MGEHYRMKELAAHHKNKYSKIVHNMDLIEQVKENFTIEQLKLLYECMDKNLSIFQMFNIHKAFIDGLCVGQIRLLMTPGLDANQAFIIRSALMDELNYDYVKLICDPRIECNNMERLYKILLSFQRLHNKNKDIMRDIKIKIVESDYKMIFTYEIIILYDKVQDDGNKEPWIYSFMIGHLPFEVFEEKLKNDSDIECLYTRELLKLSGLLPEYK